MKIKEKSFVLCAVDFFPALQYRIKQKGKKKKKNIHIFIQTKINQ